MEDLIRRDDVIKALKPIAENLSDGLQSDIATAILSIHSFTEDDTEKERASDEFWE